MISDQATEFMIHATLFRLSVIAVGALLAYLGYRLFVLGVMNLLWVAVLTIVVLAEKTLPRGELVARGLGVVLIGWGMWMLLAPGAKLN